MVSRSIPIYLGAPDVDLFFNTRSFVHVRDYADFDACIDYILKIDSDPALYKSMIQEPYFPSNRLCPKTFSYFFGGEFYQNLKNILPQGISAFVRPCQLFEEDVVLTIVGSSASKKSRLQKVAEASRFFKRLRKDPNHDALNIEVVRSALADVNEGDLVFLILNHGQLTIDGNRYESLTEYFSNLNKDTDVLSMQQDNAPRSDILMMKKTSRLMMWMEAWKSDHDETMIMSTRLTQTVLPIIHASLPDIKENTSCFVVVPK
jgi:hypothetical protein